ncbi:DUF1573 domain-containing protein [Oleiharenicola lentus]|uniref:DUF1573 domain-containing protein n=1 Tax=Oleiharenicola lentus TaxID=2508720 RepID=UPI003F660C8D
MLTALSLLCVRSGFATLTWERLVSEVDLSNGADQAEVVFRFKNTGPNPVHIAMVLSSCDCVTAELKKETYAAQESGELRATFKRERKNGRVLRTINVVTAENPETPTTLTLRIQLPEN